MVPRLGIDAMDWGYQLHDGDYLLTAGVEELFLSLQSGVMRLEEMIHNVSY